MMYIVRASTIDFKGVGALLTFWCILHREDVARFITAYRLVNLKRLALTLRVELGEHIDEQGLD